MIIIGLDWNNTIQDMIGEIISLSGHRLTRQDFSAWDIPLGYKVGMSESDFINWSWKNEAVQLLACPFSDAKETIAKLRQQGYYIKIITSSFLSMSKIIAWFDKHGIEFDEIVRAKGKSKVYADLYIDDNPDELKELIEAGKEVYKFSLPWNNEVDCPAFGWENELTRLDIKDIDMICEICNSKMNTKLENGCSLSQCIRCGYTSLNGIGPQNNTKTDSKESQEKPRDRTSRDD